MATTNRLTTWSPGDVLTASALNNEFNNILTTINGNVDADNLLLSDDYIWTGQNTYNGADKLLIPATTPTVSRSIALVNGRLTVYDGTAARTYVPVNLDAVGYHNLDITLAANVLSVTGFGGTALSSTNPAFVNIPSATAGLTVSLRVTAAQTLQDAGHGTPQVLGRWGTTASVAWGSAMPIFIGAVQDQTDSTTARFFLTRDPTLKTTPASTNNIGIGGTAPVTSNQSNIVLFGTAANTSYDSKPCIILGSLRATLDNSVGGSATIGALVAGRDGFGLFQSGYRFVMPSGQNGAASGAYLNTNGGTAPVFGTNQYVYEINTDGRCVVETFFNSDGGTDGAGAVAAQLALPYTIPAAGELSQTNQFLGYTTGATTLTGAQTLVGILTANTSYVTLQYLDAAALWTSITLAMYSNGARTIAAKLTFNAFRN